MSRPPKQTFPGGLHLGASHTLEPRWRTFGGDVRMVHPSRAHSLGVQKRFTKGNDVGGVDPMPNSWNATRMVEWHTMAVSYGGPKFNQKWVKHWKGVGQQKPQGL